MRQTGRQAGVGRSIYLIQHTQFMPTKCLTTLSHILIVIIRTHTEDNDDDMLEGTINENLLQHKTATMLRYSQANVLFLTGKSCADY